MSGLSVIIPSRNERFLAQTIDDLFAKAKGEIEIVVVLDGYWPEPQLKEDSRLVILHRGRARGLRRAVNSGVALAKFEHIMKIDAHCMFDEGYDVKLAADCESNWVAVPRRYSLDAENWCRKKKHPIDYLFTTLPVEETDYEINVKVWNKKNYDEELKKNLLMIFLQCRAHAGLCTETIFMSWILWMRKIMAPLEKSHKRFHLRHGYLGGE